MNNKMNYDKMVICGGFLRGSLLIGVFKYLSENGILDNIKEYVATSAGSIICFMYVIGYKPEEILKDMKECILKIKDIEYIKNIEIDMILNNFGVDDHRLLKGLLENKLELKTEKMISNF